MIRLRNAIGELISLPKFVSAKKEEDDKRFFAYIYTPYIAAAARIISTLASYLDIFSIVIRCDTSNGDATLVVTKDEAAASGWALSVQDNNGLGFPESGEMTGIGDFKNVLLGEKKAKSTVEVEIQITIEKAVLMKDLGWSEDVSAILFISSDKFAETVREKDFSTLDELLTLESQTTIVLLLADITGFAKGPNLRIYGLDTWASIHMEETRADNTRKENVETALQFRENECQWETGATHLTPFHLHLETNRLSNPDITDILTRHRDRLCVGYIANRLRIRDDMLICDFFGHKHVQVNINPADGTLSSLVLYNLFHWAYDNASSDKLGILRQIISLQLTEKPEKNYGLLLENANTILVSAKSNFQFFLRRSVELYFDKRLKVSEFLHKFSNEVGKSVSEMASELINNLYKTVGVVLGVIIATLVDPPKAPAIVHWTSMLYFVYVVFILFLLLPSYYLRFRGTVLEFEHNKSELRDVLLEDEIERIEGGTFKRNRLEFLAAFSLVYLGYAAMATIAFIIFRIS